MYNINNKLASDWPSFLQPNVCLSIINGLSTLAIAYAVANGIAIAWWRRAMLGASIKELHYTWAFSASVSSILLKIKYFNVIALAALAAKIAIIDGVLYQRALSTKVVQDDKGENSTLNSFFMDRLPRTGIMSREPQSAGDMDYNFAKNAWIWSTAGDGNIKYTESIDGCDAAVCSFNLTGAGLGAECVQSFVNNTYLIDAKAGRNVTGNLTLFSVEVGMVYPDLVKNYSRIRLSALWPMDVFGPDYDSSSPPVPPSTFRSVVCELRPALVRYHMLYNYAGSLQRGEKPPSGTAQGPTRSAVAAGSDGFQISSDPFASSDLSMMCEWNATICRNQVSGMSATFGPKYDIYEPFKAGVNSTLRGIHDIMVHHYVSRATTTYYDNAFHTTEAGEFASLSNTARREQDRTEGLLTYAEPIETIMGRVNTLTMILASDPYSYPGGLNKSGWVVFNKRDIPCLKYWTDKEYIIDRAYMWSAFGLTFVVIFLILPVYWGYWQLGRDVTLGPMEIAYAFQGPAFATADSQSGHADHIVKAVGRQKIQYGAVDETNKKLAFKNTSSAV